MYKGDAVGRVIIIFNVAAIIVVRVIVEYRMDTEYLESLDKIERKDISEELYVESTAEGYSELYYKLAVLDAVQVLDVPEELLEVSKGIGGEPRLKRVEVIVGQFESFIGCDVDGEFEEIGEAVSNYHLLLLLENRGEELPEMRERCEELRESLPFVE